MSINRASSVVPPSSTYEQMQAFAQRDARVPGQMINGKPSWTVDQAAGFISGSGEERHPDRNADGRTDLTYSFAKTPGSTFSQPRLKGFSEFSSQQQVQARLAMQTWSDVANITFTEKANNGSSDGHLSLGNFDEIEGVKGPNGKAITIYDPELKEHQTWFRVGSYAGNRAPGLHTLGRQTLVHEVGHHLGLRHPGHYGGPNSGYASGAQYAQDSVGHSLMSYWDERHTGQDFTRNGERRYASAPQMDDIVAIQKLYGPNWKTRSGDTVYGFRSNTGRDHYTVRNPNAPMIATIWDGGGRDTVNLSGYRNDQKVNLNAGTFSDVGGMKGNLSIAPGVVIENAIGGKGRDFMLGNQVANELRGMGGDDVMDGGGGPDKYWGGPGKDTFLFSDPLHSTAQAPDTIMDFRSGEDRIDVSNIRIATGKPALDYVDAFSGQAGQARLKYDPQTRSSTLEIDVHGRGVADFKVNVRGRVARKDIVG